MRLTIRAGGILRSGPERTLIDDYLQRANRIARAHGIVNIEEQQVDLRAARTREAETRLLFPHAKPGTIPVKYVILDERGKSLTSHQIADQFRLWAEQGAPQVTFVIGGADGFEPGALPKGVIRWAFGNQTWPHKLVRVMLSEQIYRALSILSNAPYHRD